MSSTAQAGYAAGKESSHMKTFICINWCQIVSPECQEVHKVHRSAAHQPQSPMPSRREMLWLAPSPAQAFRPWSIVRDKSDLPISSSSDSIPSRPGAQWAANSLQIICTSNGQPFAIRHSPFDCSSVCWLLAAGCWILNVGNVCHINSIGRSPGLNCWTHNYQARDVSASRRN